MTVREGAGVGTRAPGTPVSPGGETSVRVHQTCRGTGFGCGVRVSFMFGYVMTVGAAVGAAVGGIVAVAAADAATAAAAVPLAEATVSLVVVKGE